MGQTRRLRPASKSWITGTAFGVVLLGLSAGTAWNLTRTDAIAPARSAYQQGELVLCLQHALDHLERRPWSREATLLAARCLSRLDYADQAEPYFKRAGRLELFDAQLRAYGLARGPHSERAIQAYHEILENWPDNVTALRRLAAVQLAQNNTNELLSLADRLSGIPKGAVIGHTLRGVVFHNDSNPQRAIECFERVLALDPELREMPLSRRLFWSHFSDDLISDGRIDDARGELIKALANAPDADLMSRLGRIYFLQGALDEAERCFRRAAEWDPSDFKPHFDLSKIALQRQQREEALTHLNHAKLLAPEEFGVLYSLASVYRQLGRLADAARVQETVTQLRDKPASSSSRRLNAPWPRYTL
jgi:tetratricopeptide (TPR) repeat protein